jgi:hypothetical protein
MRALDRERQLGPLDATVALDARARAVLRLIPGAVRSYSPLIGSGQPPASLIERLYRNTRAEE